MAIESLVRKKYFLTSEQSVMSFSKTLSSMKQLLSCKNGERAEKHLEMNVEILFLIDELRRTIT
jgi:hypothetical protein